MLSEISISNFEIRLVRIQRLKLPQLAIFFGPIPLENRTSWMLFKRCPGSELPGRLQRLSKNPSVDIRSRSSSFRRVDSPTCSASLKLNSNSMGS